MTSLLRLSLSSLLTPLPHHHHHPFIPSTQVPPPFPPLSENSSPPNTPHCSHLSPSLLPLPPHTHLTNCTSLPHSSPASTNLIQRARDLASGAVPTAAEVLPYQPLRAKRGVSTPLMVAAAARPGRQQQQLATQPVPPVQVRAEREGGRGASTSLGGREGERRG